MCTLREANVIRLQFESIKREIWNHKQLYVFLGPSRTLFLQKTRILGFSSHLSVRKQHHPLVLASPHKMPCSSVCVATFIWAQVDYFYHKYLTFWYGTVLSFTILKQHRDTNCVFITEEKCAKPQKEGRGSCCWTCVSLLWKSSLR